MFDSEQLNITLVISSLSCGGAERVMSLMANYWADIGWEVTLITLDSLDSDFYLLHPPVKRVAMGLMRESSNVLFAIRHNLVRFAQLRKKIVSSRANVVISFMEKTNVLTLLATRGLGVRVIVSERTDPAHYVVGKVWNWLRHVTYPWADIVAVQSNQVKQWLEEIVDKAKIVVIPNPINYDHNERNYASLNDLIGGKKDKRSIVAMGRLGFEKGYDLLLKAFAKTTHLNPEWRLIIIGEGEERESLQRIANDLNIREKCFFPGRVNNAMQLLKDADLFVLSSRFEGFPNVLLEAMACGLPVISFDCPSGPREIIRDGMDGVLVPSENIDALAETMNRLMTDDSERKRLGAKAPEVIERFSLGKIMAMWEETIYKILERK